MTADPMNLIPDSVRQTRTSRRHLKRWGVACLAALVVVAFPLGVDWYRNARAAELGAQARQLAGQLSAARKEVEEATTAAREVFLQLERANALRAKRSWSGMLAMLGACMPTECWISSFATDPATPSVGEHSSPTGKPKNGDEPEEVVTIEAPRKLKLVGYALDATQPLMFVRRLKSTGVFDRVTLERSLRETGEGGARFRFELTCEW